MDTFLRFLEIVIKLADALAWPVVVAGIVYVFRSEIRTLIKRVVHDSNELSMFGISAKFVAAKNELSSMDIAESDKAKLLGVIDDIALSQIKDLSKNFYSKGLSQRSIAVKEVRQIGLDIDLNRLIELAKSELPGERIAAAIAIRTHIEKDYSVLEKQELLDTIQTGLYDQRSRVRYRFVEMVVSNSILNKKFRDLLRSMALNDDNSEVKEIISRYLGYY